MEQGDLFLNNLTPQQSRIVNRLYRGPITNIELNEMGIFRYSARIHELRDKGYPIESDRLDRAVWEFRLAR